MMILFFRGEDGNKCSVYLLKKGSDDFCVWENRAENLKYDELRFYVGKAGQKDLIYWDGKTFIIIFHEDAVG